MGRINPLVAIGLPTWGKVSVSWARSYRHLGGPLGSTMVELPPVVGEPIAKARNILMQQAIDNKCEFLFMIGDDVLAPGDVIPKFLHRMREHPEIDLLTGMYWTKSWPTYPYIWRGIQRGPYMDWKHGEFIEVDFSGCDCLMIRLSDRLKAQGPEWFATDWLWEDSQEKPDEQLNTEDFYFYTKLRKAGIKLWCDTSAQCIHEDRDSGMQFGLTTEMPQAGGTPWKLPEPGTGDVRTVIAEIGCGVETPWFGPPDKAKIIRFDINECVKPDYRCDIRHLPVPDQCMDMVFSRHCLEHFGRDETMKVLNEWSRILRIGGEFHIIVPNLTKTIDWILKMDSGEAAVDPYPWWQLYGSQQDETDVHRNGFTVRRVELLLKRMGVFEESTIKVTTRDGDAINIHGIAVKNRHPQPYSVIKEWDTITEKENLTLDGLKTSEEAAIIDEKNLQLHTIGTITTDPIDAVDSTASTVEITTCPTE